MAARGERAPLTFNVPSVLSSLSPYHHCLCVLSILHFLKLSMIRTIKKCLLNIQLLFYQVSIKKTKLWTYLQKNKFNIKTVGFCDLLCINFEQKLIARQKMPACEKYIAYSAISNCKTFSKIIIRNIEKATVIKSTW